MSTKTTNYNLTKPTDNETADISVINANMEIIDGALKAIDDKDNGHLIVDSAGNALPQRSKLKFINGAVVTDNGAETVVDVNSPSYITDCKQAVVYTESPVSVVNFIVGEISSFNPDTDYLDVYQNTVHLIKGFHYTLGDDNQTIVKNTANWDASVEAPIRFEFLLRRNVKSANADIMVRSEYDSNNNGTVDNAEKVNGLTVETAVPANALFTDTVTTVLDELNSTSTTSALSASKGKIIWEALQGLLTTVTNHPISSIDGLQNILNELSNKLASDDANFDTLQEVITKLKENVSKIADIETMLTSDDTLYDKTGIDSLFDNKVDKVTGKQLTTEDYSTVEKNKLANIEDEANKYIHPLTHSISIIKNLQSILDLKADLDNDAQTITADTINTETIVLDGTDLASTLPKVIKANFTVAPSSTETVTITLPLTNISYDLFMSGTVNNGVISYSAKIATTNDNTPMLLTRLAHMWFSGGNLRVIDPITYATNQNLFNVIEAKTDDTSYGVVAGGLGLLLKFQVVNNNTNESANCKYVITYTTS